MCGRCRQVFNAFQSLSRVEEPIAVDAASLQEAVAEDAPHDLGPPIYAPPAPFSAIGATPDLGVDSLFLREEPLALPAAFSASEPWRRAPIRSAAPPEASVRGSADSVPGDQHVTKGVSVSHLQAPEAPPVEPAIDLTYEVNPLLVGATQSGVAPERTTSRAWSFGAFALFVTLLAQASYAFRTTIVSSYPQLRPTGNWFCELAGCSLSWGRDEAALKIEASELIEAPGKPGRILLTAILVNRGKTKQDMPSLELRLTDNANQVVVSRLLHPADYLGRPLAKDEGLVPNTELYVNLNLELSNKPLASGYGLIVFYP